MKNFNDLHEFAFYSEQVKTIIHNIAYSDIQEVNDPILIHRLTNILRFTKGTNIILFDSKNNIKCTLLDIKNKNITIQIQEINKNNILTPHILWLLPLLKKEAYEESLYTLTVMGIQEIQPILTQKTQKLYNLKDQERNKKIMIAAAEQSKQFILPNLYQIVPFELWLDQNINEPKIFFDISGSPLQNVINTLKSQNAQKIIVLSGPEGDLSISEKEKILSKGFIFCSLTQTILKSEQAITVGAGALRSLL